MEDAILYLTRKGVKVLLTGLHTQPSDMLKNVNVIPDLVPTEQIFEEFEDSVNWLKQEDLIINLGDIKVA